MQNILMRLLACCALMVGAVLVHPLASWAVTPQVAAGGGHSLALMTDGSVQAWGDNAKGQLGNNSTVASHLPVPVSGLAGPVQAIAAGGTHTVVLLANGTIQAWGDNAKGQLGDGTTISRQTPVTIPIEGTVIAIAAGTSHTVALMSNGTVKAWGSNAVGQLGNDNSGMTSSVSPVEVINLEDAVTAIAAGGNHAVVLLANGMLKAWGGNSFGQLGNGTNSNSYSPVLVTSLGGAVAAIAAGGSHSLALLSNGSMMAWGANSAGQLGNGTMINSAIPVAVSSLGGPATGMAGGGSHSLALLADGTFRIWGGNSYGQLGNGLMVNNHTPQTLTAPTGLIGIAAGTSHTVTLLATGSVWSWGNNSVGQLGNGSTTSSSTPAMVIGLGEPATAVAAGDAHTLVRQVDGGVKAWGANSSGQLGNGNVVNSAVPATVTGLGGTVSTVAAGFGYSVALLSDGTVKAWGANANGQLGDGTQASKSTPVLVLGLLDTVTAIAAGYNHTAALLANGKVQTWGNNGSGQLGNNTYVNSSTPILVSTLNGPEPGVPATAIAVGYNFTVALLADGTVKSWGSNGSGQLGIGSFSGSAVPVTVVDLGQPATAISAGAYFAAALLQDGTVKTWGYNSNGQLGNGSIITSNRPVAVGLPAGDQVTAIAAGDSHLVALLADKTLKTWGLNAAGQLGDGTLVQRTTPVAVVGVSDVQFIAAGDAHTAAILLDGTIRSWGSNAQGQLGDGKGPYVPQLTQINLDNVLPTVALDRPGGNYFDSVAINLTCQDDFAGCQGIYYTDDGSTPAWPLSGTTHTYTGQLTFSQTTTLKYLAVDQAGNKSPVTAHEYAISPSTYPVTITFTGNGAVQLSNGGLCTSGCSLPVTVNATLALVPTPAAGWYFTSWSGCDSVAGTTCKVEMYAARSVTAVFAAYPTPGVTAVTAGTSHTLALLTDGTVKAWGDNSQGQLGIGSNISSIQPVIVTSLSGSVATIAAGGMNSLVLFADGTVKAWGDNNSGQLGNGTTIKSNLPVAVTDLGRPVIAIAAGASHTLALLDDGTVKAWGFNGSGQLGDGTLTNRSTPVSVTGLGGQVVAIAAGSSHSLALLADGTVLAWGYNGNGQLGDGTTSARLIPTPVIGLPLPVVRIVAGGSHSLALMSDASVRTWGYNGMGQLGNSSTYDSTSPVSPSLLGGGVIALAAGSHYSLALKSDGTIKTWGDNTRGQLGNWNTTASTVPVSVLGLSGVMTAIAAGSHTSFAISSDGVLRGWGWNAAGQIGNGSILDSSRPVTVTGVTVCNAKINTACFATLSDAYAAAVSGDTILAQGLVFPESLNTNRLITVTIRGGYAADFIAKSGVTRVSGLIATSGSVSLDELTIQ